MSFVLELVKTTESFWISYLPGQRDFAEGIIIPGRILRSNNIIRSLDLSRSLRNCAVDPKNTRNRRHDGVQYPPIRITSRTPLIPNCVMWTLVVKHRPPESRSQTPEAQTGSLGHKVVCMVIMDSSSDSKAAFLWGVVSFWSAGFVTSALLRGHDRWSLYRIGVTPGSGCLPALSAFLVDIEKTPEPMHHVHRWPIILARHTGYLIPTAMAWYDMV